MSDPAEKTQNRASGPALHHPPPRASVTGVEVAAAVLCILWLAAAVVFFVLRPEGLSADLDGQKFLITLMTIFLPVAMIWVAAMTARASRIMREESARLQTAIDAIRQAYVAQAPRGPVQIEPALARKLDAIEAAARRAETAVDKLTAAKPEQARPIVPAPAPQRPSETPQTQGSLELGTPAEALAEPLPTSDFLRALNFPETAEDRDGFAALRRALKDRKSSQLIQAAQDVLTLLSQDGIYMDDLRPDKARPDIWRAFASGARGRAVAALGGVRDRSSLALTAARMKQDPIFRDAAHHFLRKFDQTISDFAETASDEEISALSETRTARAFMLLGRAAGTFK